MTPRAAIVLFAALQIPAAFLSLGHHHPDEHFQILEFLNYTLGRTPPDKLPWEFGARIRPFVQIALYYPVVAAERGAGVASPFVYEITLRLTSALLGIGAFAAAVTYFARRCAFGPKALIAMATFAALPYLNARLSAETVGPSVFFIGVFLAARAIDDRRAAALLAAGALLGLGFYIRFQIAFMLLGLAAWLVAEKHALTGRRVASVAWLACGFALALLAGVAADRWGYGVWVFTPWQYFDVNLLQHRAADWGTSPWWEYLRIAAYRLMPPFGVLYFAVAGWFLLRDRRSLLVYLLVPFLVGHSIIGHKEHRFLFPLVVPFTIMLGLFVQAVVRPGWTTIAYRTFFAINVLWLAVLPYRPASFEVMLYRHVYGHGIRDIYSTSGDPYVIAGLPVYFYRPTGLQVHVVPESEMEGILRDRPIRLFADRLHPFQAGSLLDRACTPEYRSVPDWAESVNVNNWLSRVPVWSLYDCVLR